MDWFYLIELLALSFLSFLLGSGVGYERAKRELERLWPLVSKLPKLEADLRHSLQVLEDAGFIAITQKGRKLIEDESRTTTR